MPSREIPHTVQAIWQSLALDQTQMGLAVGQTIRPAKAGARIPRRASGEVRLEEDEPLEAFRDSLPKLRIAGAESADDAEGGEAADLRVLSVLGEGGMGVVERARQRSLDREVAIKRVREDRRDDHTVHALLREALIAGGLEHPSIIPIHALGVDAEGAPLLVMKKVEGVSWQEVLTDPEHPFLEGRRRSALEYHLEILSRVCHAVEFAHSKGILHLDIKPENVMIGPFGEVYLLDWGIALPLREPRSPQIAGTPAYMAPEMVLLSDPLSPRTDVYLLGAVLHQVLTGRPRHATESFHEAIASIVSSEEVELPPHIHREIAGICNRAIRRAPEDRFASVKELREAIESYLLHRASIDLTQAAEATLREVEALLNGVPDDPGQSVEIEVEAHRAFTEARFGFRQALRIWPENDEARRGLEEVLLRMVLTDIRWGNLASAAAHLQELKEPPKALVEALEEAQREKEREAERVRELERQAHELDPSVESRKRSRLMLLVTINPPLASLITYLIIQIYRIEFDMVTYMVMVTARAVPAWIAAAVVFRSVKNEMNHRVVTIGGTLFGAMGASVFVSHAFGATVHQALASEAMIGALAMVLCGILIRPGYFKAVIPFLTFILAMGLAPAYALELYLLTGVFLVIWWVVIAVQFKPGELTSDPSQRRPSAPAGGG